MLLSRYAVCTPVGGMASVKASPFADDAANAAPVESLSATTHASRTVSTLPIEFMTISFGVFIGR
jgi:hypothetical protein